MPFEDLLIKNTTFTIHHENIQSLAIEINITINNLLGGYFSKYFVRNNHKYKLSSESELGLKFNTVFKGQNSVSYFGSTI